MIARFSLLVMATMVALVVGCGGSGTTARTPSVAGATATAGAGEAPVPRHLVFAAGETIAADGQAGIFFLDPKTGAAEGWVVPAATFPGLDALPFSFTVGGFSADGGHVVYTCLEAKEISGPVPCGGGADRAWSLLDTKTDRRTRIEGFSGAYLGISPDGKTLVGSTASGIALADAADSRTLRPVALPAGSDTPYAHADWSPDSTRLVLTMDFTPSVFLVDTKSGAVSDLGVADYVAWSPDGSRLVLRKPVADSLGEFRMLDRDGRLVWSKRADRGASAGGWSADGSLLYAEVQERPTTLEGYGPLERVEVLDAVTGATKYRVPGGFCPIGWVGKTHRLLTGSYGFGEALVDLAANAVRLMDVYAMPMPFDPDMAIQFDGNDFRLYDLETGATRLIAHTTVVPAWDSNHGALFAGNRLVFTARHGGHGGCGEGASPKDPPRPELLAGPFADDAPVTRGPAQ